MTFRFVSRKVLGSLATLLFVVCFNFFLFRVVESDPVSALFRGRNISQQQRQQLQHDFGLDKSKPEQFVRYLNQTAHLNFGFSFETRQPVTSEISARIGRTITLVGISTLLSTTIGIWLGIIAAWRRNTPTDYVVTSTTMAFYAMPDFWLGLLLLAAFAESFRWFPTGGIVNVGSGATGLSHLVDEAKHLFLPGLTLTLAYLGEYTLIMRSSLLDTMGEDYLTLARAKGLRDATVRRRHAVPNALLPIVTLAAVNFGFVLSGAIAVESIYSWPGLGLATYNAIRAPDLPMLQGLFLLFSAAVIVANLAVDLLYAYLDPRVRTA
ncbi:MAG: transporter permease [Actinomycetia bacterium]|nr:transporter permease [Actinomycetes bacterium]